MTASVIRWIILVLWLASSVAGLGFATMHVRASRHSWRVELWRGTDEEEAARFHRLLGRAFLSYFILVVVVGLFALLWPSPPQPFRPSSMIAPLGLIISNGLVLWGISLLRHYELISVHLEPHRTLEEILTELKTNDGSTLRDVADRLERAAEANVIVSKQQAIISQRLERLVTALGVKIDAEAQADAEHRDSEQ